MQLLHWCQRIITWLFYALFFLTPFLFSSETSELFEFNKMWFVYSVTILILGTWIVAMIAKRKCYVQRSPLDIFILLFLGSQIISTIFSIAPYISFWGYYGRFNGGLLSTISYIILYYAFLTNISFHQVKRMLFTMLISGLCVALWGLPSHFGYDPTCFLFRGELNVNCWTEAFQPKIRIFSTLGQPGWLAAYLVALLPISLIFLISHLLTIKKFTFKLILPSIAYFLLILLFYIDILYTRARSGFVGLWVALMALVTYILWIYRKKLLNRLFLKATIALSVGVASLLVITFFIGTPIGQLDKFTFPALVKHFKSKPAQPISVKAQEPIANIGGTDSGQIRLIVWEGALNAWKHYPIIGSGVETFAFAYYQYRPTAHNMTSEWDYLYNKAHNEYLNFLTTTGILGLGSYVLLIAAFLFLAIKKLSKAVYILEYKATTLRPQREERYDDRIYVLGLLAGFISILITNFFSFSVVIINVFFFIFMASVFLLEHTADKNQSFLKEKQAEIAKTWQFIILLILGIAILTGLITLFRYWNADKQYALGNSLHQAGYYEQAAPYLKEAVQQKPEESVFLDQLANNDAFFAITLAQNHEATAAGQLAQEAIEISNKLTQENLANIVFWKSRIRIMYALANLNPEYNKEALVAGQRAHALAPTDAKISHNVALLTAQNGNVPRAIEIMKETIKLKHDYRDAYYALGIFYHQAALGSDGATIQDPAMQKKAIETMQYILNNFSKDDKEALTAIQTWEGKVK